MDKKGTRQASQRLERQASVKTTILLAVMAAGVDTLVFSLLFGLTDPSVVSLLFGSCCVIALTALAIVQRG
jgi:hypothetical protein